MQGELEEVVAYLKDPQKYTVLGGKLPKGVLLVGPPGAHKQNKHLALLARLTHISFTPSHSRHTRQPLAH